MEKTNKELKEKAHDLVPVFSLIMALFVLVLIWNLVGAVLAAISITGIAAWLLQVFALIAVVHLDVHTAVCKGATLFAEGAYEVFFPETESAPVSTEAAQQA